MEDKWNGTTEPLLQDEEEDRYQEYLQWLESGNTQ